MNEKYKEILHLPHHQSSKRTLMSMENRAAQFSPFAALVGYDDQIEETNRFKQDKIELSEYDLSQLNETLQYCLNHIKENLEISVLFYDSDLEIYTSKTGVLKRIEEIQRNLVFKDGTKIGMDDVLEIVRKSQE